MKFKVNLIARSGETTLPRFKKHVLQVKLKFVVTLDPTNLELFVEIFTATVFAKYLQNFLLL